MQAGSSGARVIPGPQSWRIRIPTHLIAVLSGLATLVGAVAYLKLRRCKAEMVPEVTAVPAGLSEAEARKRYLRGEAKASQRSIIRSAENIRRESVFTVFHLNLIGLALVQLFLLYEWLSGVLTLVGSGSGGGKPGGGGYRLSAEVRRRSPDLPAGHSRRRSH